jgi:antitoxin HigA-1
MIKNFKHKGLQSFFETGSKAGIQPSHAPRLSRQLARLDVAAKAEDLNLPGWKCHRLAGSSEGHWSVWVMRKLALNLCLRKRRCRHCELPRLSLRMRVMTAQHKPPHPGETLREDVLPSLGLTVTEAAKALSVARATFSKVLNGRAAISPQMALRLEKWLGTANGGDANLWLSQQMAFDLWEARKKKLPNIKPVTAQNL